MELDAPREAADAEALRAAASRPCVDLDGAGRRLDAVLVPVQRVGAGAGSRPAPGRRAITVDRRPRDEPALAGATTSPPSACASSCAPRQTPRNGISRATASRISSTSGAKLRVPRRLLAAEGDDRVDLVEVGQRAPKCSRTGAQRRGRVAEERLLQMVDDGDVWVSRAACQSGPAGHVGSC